MPTTNDELLAIKEAVSRALIDAFGIDGNGERFIAVLGSIDSAVQMADADLPPFHIGARVIVGSVPSAPEALLALERGTVTRRVETSEGELHTVLVRWDDDGPLAAAEPFSPAMLSEVDE